MIDGWCKDVGIAGAGGRESRGAGAVGDRGRVGDGGCVRVECTLEGVDVGFEVDVEAAGLACLYMSVGIDATSSSKVERDRPRTRVLWGTVAEEAVAVFAVRSSIWT